MSQRRLEHVESRPAENTNRTPSNVWAEVHDTRRNNRRVEPVRQERTEQPKRATDTPRPEQEAPRQRAEPKTLDCSQGCPFKSTTSARSEMRGGDSGVISRSDAQLLRNFDPSKGPMSERLMTAIEKLRKHAMDVAPDGKPLWTKYAPTNSEARALFKDHVFAGDAGYSEARESRRWDPEAFRNYGENYKYGDAAYIENPTPWYNTRSVYGDGRTGVR